MKILFINKTLSGPMEQLARYLTLGKGCSSIFMAERWSREAPLAGCAMVRIPSASVDDYTVEKVPEGAQTVESMLLRIIRNAANVRMACERLAQNGFIPDVIYATAHDGYALDVREVFPDARMVARLDWLFPPKDQHFASKEGTPCFAFKNMYNGFLCTLLAQCEVGIAASHWQKAQIDEGFKHKIAVINNGVDTLYFTPPTESSAEEIVTFSCHGKSRSRGAHLIFKCLPQVLDLRPQCKINIVSFASRKTNEGKIQHGKELAMLLPPMTSQQRQRVTIISSPASAAYRSLLQQSRLYVYLTAPCQLSAGIMEAMSCGALVLASDTEAVRELITTGESGILWEGGDAQSLAFQVAEACSKASSLQGIRRQARATILAKHDVRALVQHHAKVVLGA